MYGFNEWQVKPSISLHALGVLHRVYHYCPIFSIFSQFSFSLQWLNNLISQHGRLKSSGAEAKWMMTRSVILSIAKQSVWQVLILRNIVAFTNLVKPYSRICYHFQAYLRDFFPDNSILVPHCVTYSFTVFVITFMLLFSLVCFFHFKFLSPITSNHFSNVKSVT